jgi:hypothetical protein
MGYPTADRNAFLTSQITGTLYIGLWTVAPDDDGVGGTEVAEASYSRVAHSAWNTAAAGSRTNNGDIDFGDPLTDWGTIVAVTAHTAITGGTQKAVSTAISETVVSSVNSVKILDTTLNFQFNTP